MADVSYPTAIGVAVSDSSNVTELSDGSLVYVVGAANSPYGLYVYRSTDNGATFYRHCTISNVVVTGNVVMISSRGMKVAFAYRTGTGGYTTSIGGFDISAITSGATLTTTSPGVWTPFVLGSDSNSQPFAIYYASDGYIYLSWYTFHNYTVNDDEYHYWLSSIAYGGSSLFLNYQVNPTGIYSDGTAIQSFAEFQGRVVAVGVAGSQYTYTIPLGTATVYTPAAAGYNGYVAGVFAHPSNGYLYLIVGTNTTSFRIYRTADITTAANPWVQVGTTTYGTGTTYVSGAQMGADGLLYVFSVGGVSGGFVCITILDAAGNILTGLTNILSGVSGYTPMAYYQSKVAPMSKGNGAAGKVSITSSFSPTSNTNVYTWTRSFNTKPNPPIVSTPVTNGYYNTKRPTTNWAPSDPDAGDVETAFQVVYSRDGFATWYHASGVVSSSATSYTPTIDLPDGTWQVVVQTYDKAGAVSDWGGWQTFYIDTTPPTIGSISGTIYTKTATQRVTITGVTDANSGIRNVDAYILNKAQNTWSGPFAATNDGGGTWHYDFNVGYEGDCGHIVRFWAYNNAANDSRGAFTGAYLDTWVYYDATAPAAPTKTNGTLYATTNGVTWSAFSDGSGSSGLLSTLIYLQKWNGSAWADVSGYPKSISGLSYSFTGLDPGTQYRWGLVYTDNAGNANALTYTTFTTNSYTITTMTNVSASGSILNKRPKFKFTETDANNGTIQDFQLQVSTSNGFGTLTIDATKSANAAGWASVTLPSGGTQYYTPQTDLAAGTYYVRARGNDGIEWGTWSTTASFTIAAVSYPTTVSDTDTAVSKRTIDDIRTKINQVRQARGLAVINWTDPTIKDWNDPSGGTNVKATHVIELRQAITDIYTSLANAAPTWTDIVSEAIDRKGKHWAELRTALAAA